MRSGCCWFYTTTRHALRNRIRKATTTAGSWTLVCAWGAVYSSCSGSVNGFSSQTYGGRTAHPGRIPRLGPRASAREGDCTGRTRRRAGAACIRVHKRGLVCGRGATGRGTGIRARERGYSSAALMPPRRWRAFARAGEDSTPPRALRRFAARTLFFSSWRLVVPSTWIESSSRLSCQVAARRSGVARPDEIGLIF